MSFCETPQDALRNQIVPLTTRTGLKIGSALQRNLAYLPSNDEANLQQVLLSMKERKMDDDKAGRIAKALVDTAMNAYGLYVVLSMVPAVIVCLLLIFFAK